MKRKDVLFWIWLSQALGAENRNFLNLISLYEQPYDIFHADASEIELLQDLSPVTRSALADKNLREVSLILDACEKRNIGILTYDDEAYPFALRDIQAPPSVLYYRGNLPDLNKRLCVGMVGTRRMSAYGMESAYKISYELASANAVVISGMAAGIDGVCAAAALAAKGSTVAVLGCGVDVVYPKSHVRLSQAICNAGALISEYPPGTAPRSYHFPVRNRIISGMSQATVVVEAGEKSGSLITARDAISQGRAVFALPANIGTARSVGTNSLLRDGAHLVLDTRDILEPYQFIYTETLHSECLDRVRERSQVSLPYLREMGVIESERTAEYDAVLPRRSTSHDEPVQIRQMRLNPDVLSVSETEKEKAEPSRDATTVRSRQSSEAPIASLTPIQIALLRAIPDDRAISADELNRLDYSIGEIAAALTMLEIMGLIQKLPGALYTKI